MSTETNYWSRKHLSRRRFVQGTAAGGFGMAVAALAGCGDDDAPASGSTTAAGGNTPQARPTGAPTSAQPNVKPVVGGDLKIVNIARPRDFDPHRSTDFTTAGLSMIMDMAIAMDKDFKLTPGLVKSWEIVGKGEAYIFKIQPDAKWHNKPPVNGRAVDAEDIVYNLMRIAGKQPGDKAAERPRAGTLSGFDKAEATDKETVRITMKAPNASFLTGVTDYRNRMVPKEMPGQLSFDDPKQAIGSGPFLVQKHDTNVEVIVARNPEYWRKDASGQKFPYLDRVQCNWLGDDAATMAAFIAKQVHYRLVNSPVERDTVKKGRPDTVIVKHPVGNRDQWRFNTARKPFDDPRVRKAMTLAFDFVDINDAYYGAGNWDYSAVIPSSFPGALTSADVKKLPGFNPDTKAKDLADAKKLMEAAGYPDGEKISIGILPFPTVEPYATHAVNIQAQMKKSFPKMQVKIDPAPDSATFTRLQAEGNFDTTSFAIIPSFDSALDFQIQYATTGSRNYGKYSNKQLDTLLDQALAEFDDAKRSVILKQAQQLVIDDGNPTIWLNQQFYFHALDPLVKGVQELASASTYGGSGAALPMQLSDLIWLAKA